MKKTALALRHVHFEDLGAFETPLREAGYAILYCDIGVDDPLAGDRPDLLAVLGAPIGAYEDDSYPYLRDELALIASRLAAGLPTLGICLGAQLMARALGARVYPGPGKEIGWKKLELTSAGSEILAPFEDHPVLHWHGDTFDLPEGAINLAKTDLCDQQAFVYKAHAMAFQFHPEARADGFERWLIGHAGEIAATRGVTVAGLRADTKRFAAQAASYGKKVLTDWLARIP